MSDPEYGKLVRFTKGLVWDMPECVPEDVLHDVLMLAIEGGKSTRAVLKTNDFKAKIRQYVKHYKLNVRGRTFLTDNVSAKHSKVSDSETCRYCRKCKDVKPMSAFKINYEARRNGYRISSHCRECEADYMKEYLRQNAARINANQRKYQQKIRSTEAYKESRKRYMKENAAKGKGYTQTEEYKAKQRERAKAWRVRQKIASQSGL